MHLPTLTSALLFGATLAHSKAHSATKRQDGTVDPSTAADCTYFDTAYDASQNCVYFETSWGVSAADFLDWNPSVKADCSGIKVGYSYCVEVNNGLPRPTSSTKTTSSTATPTPTGNGIATPSPIQTGMTTSCDSFYFVKSGDECGKIASANGISLQQFYDWNPAVGSSCGGLWLDTYVCVSIIGVGPTITSSSTTTTPTNGITTPQPIQTGMVSNCDAFYFVKSGDSCADIASSNGITLQRFYSWNPAVGSSCGSLWLDTYVCVSIVGEAPATTTSKSATTSPTNGITTPQPIQTEMVSNCDAFYYVKSGDECGTIASKNGISLSQFYAWNPAVGTSCGGLWLDTYVCVSIVGVAPSTTTTSKATTTSAGNGVTTPTPIQAGMTTSCKTFHYVATGETCATVIKDAGISLATFYSWNPAVKSDCSGLWSETYCCIAVL